LSKGIPKWFEVSTDFNWLDAAKSNEEKLNSKSDNGISTAELFQELGFCYSLASRQAEEFLEFKKIRQKAVEAYESAAKFFGKDSGSASQGKSFFCLCQAEYTRSWLLDSSSEKNEALLNCCKFGQKSLENSEKAGDKFYYAETCVVLSRCFFDRLYLANTEDEKIKLAQEGIELCEEAIKIFRKLEKEDDLLLALSFATLLSWYYANIGKETLRHDLAKKCLAYSEEARELSGRVRNLLTKTISLWAQAFTKFFFTEEIETSLEYARKMLENGKTLKDNYFKGIAYYLLAFFIDHITGLESNPDKKKQWFNEIIRYSEESIKYLQFVGQEKLIAEVYQVYPQSYFLLSREFATTPTEKLALSKKSVRIGEKGLEYAMRSGSPDAIGSSLHSLSKAYHYYSNLEPRQKEKSNLLITALEYRKEFVKIVQEALTSNFWILGVGLVYAAQIEMDLAKFESESEKKRLILQDAIYDIEKGVTLCEKWVTASLGSSNVPSLVATVADFEDNFGAILKENYSLTNNGDNLTKAIKIYEQAAENFKKVDLPSRVAESYWKIATSLDILGEHSESAKNFERAFAGYKSAAKKIEHFSDFYLDYSNYMKAWSEIENAKRAHNDSDFNNAMQHYQKASNLIKLSRIWNYLSLNFHSWSLLEQAEDLSRLDKSKESIESFETAIRFLKESKTTLETELQKIDKKDEKSLVQRLIEASAAREDFCSGRIALEEAKILNRKSIYIGSSEKYDAAAVVFQKISDEYSEQIAKEAQPLYFLCQAWQKMTLAQARNSPILFEEAAELFKRANDYATNESASLLALAHSSFCKALETGTEFEITRNIEMYRETKKHMDSAASYYLRAGYATFSDYANATQRLFDAYVFIDKAKSETDPSREAKFFVMAEKVLQVSVDSYAKAKYQEKADQVKRLLQKVKEEKELALSLSDVFHAPAVTSSAGNFTMLNPSHEIAVGLDRFEHADIQMKIVQEAEKISVGDDINVKLQFVNVGKEAVLLVRIENVLPADFQLIEKPDNFSFENMQLVSMGKRIDPLATEEIALTMRPFKSGAFEVQPRIICAAETGDQLSFTAEPITFSVSDAVLPGRIRTGYKDLDNLLLGGLPEGYAIVLASPSNDERELLVRRFLETGIKNDEITLYITVEVAGVKALAEEFTSNFYLFVCNQRADVMIKSLPNVYKLKGVENLTDINISLVRAFRSIDFSKTGAKRACIEVISDVLLQHHAVITRKWLSGLLPDLRSKGFTTLAIINPQMHSAEEVHAILGLFDGEIRISERETDRGLEKVLRIRKLYNQRYIENELIVTRKSLQS
jgi:KaiC/GvpD/RAD55 family RecA-like ATPase